MNRKSIITRSKGFGRKLPGLLAAGAMAALLNSCGDNVVENSGKYGSDAANKTANVYIYIRDGIGGGDISDDSVTITFYGKEQLTVDLKGNAASKKYEVGVGGVTFKDVPVGTYSARVTKPGYATVFLDNIEIKNGDDYYPAVGGNNGSVAPGQDIYIPRGVSEVARLYPLTATIKGEVYYKKENNKQAPAAGAQVKVELTDPTIANRFFTVSADDNGKFTFEGVAAVPSGYPTRVTALGGEFDGVTFAETGLTLNTSLNPDPKAVSQLPSVLTYNTPIKKFLVLSSPIAVDSDEPLKFEFDGEILTSAVGFANVSVYAIDVSGNRYNYPRTVSYDDDDKTLVITPVGRKWSDNANNQKIKYNELSVSFNGVTSVDGYVTGSDVYTVSIKTGETGFGLISETELIIDSSATIELVFSDKVDLTKVTKADILSITAGGVPGTTVDADNYNIDWDGNPTIKVSPVNKWTTDPLYVNLSGSLVSEIGEKLDGDGIVKVSLTKSLVPFVLLGADSLYTTAGLPSGKKLIIADSSKPVVLKFNGDIDTSKLKVTVENGTGTPQPNKVTYSDLKTITITPLRAQGWDGNELKISFTDLKSKADPTKTFTKIVPVEITEAKKRQFIFVYKVAAPGNGDTDFRDTVGRVSKAAVVLEFSDTIDTREIITALPVLVSENQAVTVDIADNTITLTPLDNWIFNATDYFTITFNSGSPSNPALKSVTGEELGSTPIVVRVYRKSVDVKLAKVEEFKIDSIWKPVSQDAKPYVPLVNSGVYLSWKKVEDATSYRIWRAHKDTVADKTNFVVAVENTGNLNSPVYDRVSYRINQGATAALKSGKNVYFVQAINGSSEGLLTGDRDSITTRPTIAFPASSPSNNFSVRKDSTDYAYNNDAVRTAILGGAGITLGTYEFRIRFTERIDLGSVDLTPWTSTQGNGFKATPEWDQTGLQSGIYDLVFKIEVTASGISLGGTTPITFKKTLSGIKSAAGQDLFVRYDKSDTGGVWWPVEETGIDLSFWIRD